MDDTESVDTHVRLQTLQALQEAGLTGKWAIEQDELRFDFGRAPIAKGSGGDIFKVKWRGIVCAVKKLENLNVKSRRVIQDFGHEIEVMSTLRHPNLVLFLGAVFDSQPPMLIMEYAPIGTLESVLNTIKAGDNRTLARQVKKKQKMSFVNELALGMNFLHKCDPPVIHRDLTPTNVLLDQDYHIKISDFALARFQSDKNIMMQDHTHENVESDSYRYMAPEVYTRAAYNEKVDIYSYGLIVYFIMSGTRPFHRIDDPIQAVEAATGGERPPLDPIRPVEIRSIVRDAWDGDATERPSFEDILVRVNDLLETRNTCILF